MQPLIDMSASSVDDKLWAKCLKRVAYAWTGFQIAVDMQCKGPHTNEVSSTFLKALGNYVAYDDVTYGELVDWIEENLDQEMDLYLEDGSIEWAAESLLKCKDFLINNNAVELEKFLDSLPTEDAVWKAKEQSRWADPHQGEDDEELEIDEEDMVMDSASNLSIDSGKKSGKLRNVTDDEGWTTVVRR